MLILNHWYFLHFAGLWYRCNGHCSNFFWSTN